MESLKASRTPDSIDNDRYTEITNGQVYFMDMKEGRLRSIKPLRYNRVLFIFS